VDDFGVRPAAVNGHDEEKGQIRAIPITWQRCSPLLAMK